jgi:bacteriocin-like protein
MKEEEEKKPQEGLAELTDAEMEQVSGGLGGDSPMLKQEDSDDARIGGRTKWGDIVLKRG